MLSVTHNAFDMSEEIRRQFREPPGILAGTETPDYDAVWAWPPRARSRPW